jgi:hypothetical protein
MRTNSVRAAVNAVLRRVALGGVAAGGAGSASPPRRAARAAAPWLVAPLALVAGCAPALSTFQPAHVAAKGGVQAEAGVDVSVPTSGVVGIVDTAKTLIDAAERRELSEGEKQTLYDAGASLAVNALAPVPHVGLAYVPVERLEVSLRYTGALRVGARYQLLEQGRHGVDFSAGLGAARYTLAFPVNNVLDIVEIDDFERWQFDAPLLFGRHGDWYRVWGGPKVMFTTFGTEMSLALPSAAGGGGGTRELASFEGRAFYLGGQAGAALGYKHVFLGFELTISYLAAKAELRASGAATRSVDLDSLVVAPGLALMTEF